MATQPTDQAPQAEAQPKKSFRERIVTSAPIILTVIATVLAGLSSSEMTQAMFWRSLATQHQAKEGDQWSFFQAKRIRGTNLELTVDVLGAIRPEPPLTPTSLQADSQHLADLLDKNGGAAKVKPVQQRIADLLAKPENKEAMLYVCGPQLPTIQKQGVDDPAITEALKAVRDRRPDAETVPLVSKVPFERLEEACRVKEANMEAFDQACKPATGLVRELTKLLKELNGVVGRYQPEGTDPSKEVEKTLSRMNGTFRSARHDFTARRYEQEARLNQELAELYELRVVRSGVESDRHRTRSKNFFYGMLAAQVGVTVAALALSQPRRGLMLVLVAFLAGFSALAFGGYIFVAV